MSQIGLNHRLSVANAFKQQTRALYEGVLGATVTLPRPDVEIFIIASGSGIRDRSWQGAHARAAPEGDLPGIRGWGTKRRPPLSWKRLGMRPFEYFDKAHEYFQAPGGKVFRIAQH